jgi:SNF2 family DNA or RNA helicase
MKAKIESDADALKTGVSEGRRTQQAQEKADDDLDGLSNLLGGLSVETKQCGVCKSRLSQDDIAKGTAKCADCVADLEENLAQERRKYKSQRKKSKKARQEKSRLRQERQRRRVVDSDDDEAECIVSKEKQTTSDGHLNTDDEDDEAGGEWLGNEDSETDDEDEHGEDRESQAFDEEDSIDRSANINFYKPVRFESDKVMEELPPSTKVKRLLEILKEETPEHKVIVFSQFTSMLDIIEPFLAAEGHRFVRYDGSMRNDQREESLNLLRNNKKIRVLLCSLKCGSLGLNLTAASRVVIMEPFWNPVSRPISPLLIRECPAN